MSRLRSFSRSGRIFSVVAQSFWLRYRLNLKLLSTTGPVQFFVLSNGLQVVSYNCKADRLNSKWAREFVQEAIGIANRTKLAIDLNWLNWFKQVFLIVGRPLSERLWQLSKDAIEDDARRSQCSECYKLAERSILSTGLAFHDRTVCSRLHDACIRELVSEVCSRALLEILRYSSRMSESSSQLIC